MSFRLIAMFLLVLAGSEASIGWAEKPSDSLAATLEGYHLTVHQQLQRGAADKAAKYTRKAVRWLEKTALNPAWSPEERAVLTRSVKALDRLRLQIKRNQQGSTQHVSGIFRRLEKDLALLTAPPPSQQSSDMSEGNFA